MAQSSDADRIAAEIAGRQHGNVTRRQLLRAGVTSGQISRRLASGHLIHRFAGVYAVGHVPPTPVSRAAAALLACGPTAALSHASAAALWNIWRWGTRLDVTVTSATCNRRPGIRVHRCTTLAHRDLTTHFGLRVTSPARTLLAMAPRMSPAQLSGAYDELRAASFLRAAELAELLERCPHAPGAGKLRPLLDARGGPTRSKLERDFQAFIAEQGLPRPYTNVQVAGHEVDAFYPEQRLIIELDSVGFHLSRRAFETDRDRDADTLAAGCRTVRLTHERMVTAPEREAARLRAILDQ